MPAKRGRVIPRALVALLRAVRRTAATPVLLVALLGGAAAAEPAPPGPATPPPSSLSAGALELLRGFHFGSYGRVGISGDLREGSRAKALNLVAHGPRLEEPAYLELDLGYRLEREPGQLSFRVLSTVAFLEDLFHYDGKWSAKVALRNLFAEADHVFARGLSVWAGSRMLRGDDIYLLDFWPLDNLNTLGGGAAYRRGTFRVALHVGVSRLDDLFQHQILSVPDPTSGVDEVEVLDRQRTTVSLKVGKELPELLGKVGLKLAAYGELHRLPSGTQRKNELQTEELPSDLGWTAGLQLGLFGLGGESGHLNLWARFAGGLAAYGDLSIPTGLGPDKRSTDAREVLLALSGNWERRWLGLMVGGYLRYFRDGDRVASDVDDGWEYVLVTRPQIFVHRHFHQAFELSYQGRRPSGLDPESGTHLVPGAFKLSVLPTLAWDRGSYARPQLRAIYTLTLLDAGARLLFPREDPRRGVGVHHFVGLQAEWWWRSSYR